MEVELMVEDDFQCLRQHLFTQTNIKINEHETNLFIQAFENEKL